MKRLLFAALVGLALVGCRVSNAQTVIAPGGAVTVTCSTSPTPPGTCTYTYSAWSACSSAGAQTHTVTGSSPAGCVGTPILSQACTPTPPDGCVVRPIPFAEYLAAGCDLVCVQTSKGWGALHQMCEYEAAYAAGYPRPPTPDGGTGGGGSGPACPSTSSGVMSWEAAANNNGCLYYLWGSGGCKSFTVPAGYGGTVTLENVINTNSTHSTSTATINGQDPVTIGGQGGISHQVSLAPGGYNYCVSLATPGGVTVTMRHYP